jgi:LCP family protein required for cell wall assembly
MNKQMKKAVVFVSLLILVLVILYSGLRLLESTVLAPEQPEETPAVSKTITRNGVSYFPRQDITVFMILGIDEFGPVKDSNSYNNEGEADVILLAILDESEKTYSVLALNRDTMADVSMLGLGGKYAGTYFEQLALAHTYGSGLEDSCENTKKTVSEFLNGVKIDYYLSMNMDAIGILNDAVGGVSVTVTDDFSLVDPSIQTGEMVLSGEQALHFIRLRKDVGVQLNVARMERQREYMDGFVAALQAQLERNNMLIYDVYEDLAPYIVTDCSVNTLSNLANRFVDYTLKEIVSPEGENVLTKKFYEFYVDEEKMDELILRFFYAEK